jgi:hypothetical protein
MRRAGERERERESSLRSVLPPIERWRSQRCRSRRSLMCRHRLPLRLWLAAWSWAAHHQVEARVNQRHLGPLACLQACSLHRHRLPPPTGAPESLFSFLALVPAIRNLLSHNLLLQWRFPPPLPMPPSPETTSFWIPRIPRHPWTPRFTLSWGHPVQVKIHMSLHWKR